MSNAIDLQDREAAHSLPGETDGSSRQIVGFRLDQEEYGIEITKIQEIILMGEITRVPQVPDYIEGLINLRGSVIPIIDLRKRFELPAKPYTDETRTIVVNIENKTIGVIVDAVTQVIRVANEHVEPAPPTVAAMGKEHIAGLAKLEDRLLILLKIDRLLDPEPSENTEQVTI